MTICLVSLVLATYGRCTDVGRLLDSLAAQTDSAFEVLVIDQNPDERLREHIDHALAHGLSIRHLRLAKPSLSGARNLGIAQALGEIIGFPDDDCWYEQDTVAKVRAAFAQTDDIEGVVGTWVELLPGRNGTTPTGSLLYADWRRFRGQGASSITLFFSRKLCARLNGFDERFGVGKWYGAAEETDFILRALASGARVDYCPEAIVHHAPPLAAMASLLASCRSMRSRGRGTGGVYGKHRMSAWVILRGIAGQVVRPLLAGHFRRVPIGASASLGFVEGLVVWRCTESR